MIISHPVVLFDGVCNFCNRMVHFAIRNDKKGKLKFAPLQSEAGKKLVENYNVTPSADTIVFIEKDRAYTFARAAIRISRHLDWPAKAMYVLIVIPAFISQPVYKWIARNRYKWFGKRETCMVPGPDVQKRFLS